MAELHVNLQSEAGGKLGAGAYLEAGWLLVQPLIAWRQLSVQDQAAQLLQVHVGVGVEAGGAQPPLLDGCGAGQLEAHGASRLRRKAVCLQAFVGTWMNPHVVKQMDQYIPARSAAAAARASVLAYHGSVDIVEHNCSITKQSNRMEVRNTAIRNKF